MSVGKDLLDRPMEGRAPGDWFGKEGVPAHLTKAPAEPALRVELAEERGEALPEGANPLPNRRNGGSPKTVATESGKVLPGIPRHRPDTVLAASGPTGPPVPGRLRERALKAPLNPF